MRAGDGSKINAIEFRDSSPQGKHKHKARSKENRMELEAIRISGLN